MTEHNQEFWTSELNQNAEIKKSFRDSGPIRFYDTTLRDGEQTVGAVFNPDQKVEIAQLLDRLGVSRIEAGFPRVSEADFEAFERILGLELKAEVWGFSRALEADVEALVDLGVCHAVIEVPTSAIKLEAYRLTREKVIERAATAIKLACDHSIEVAFFAVDGTRTELGFLKEIYQAAIAAGAKEAAVVDTIGACNPEAIEFLVRSMREWLGPKIPLHFHGHDDFGLATASAIAAVRGGADWIQGTINGMGERAGNADIAEVALALQGLYDVPVALDLSQARIVAARIQDLGGYALAPWKPVVGDNLFIRESGAVAAQFHIPSAIEPYSAKLVGAERGIVLGKKSGLASIDLKARELGLELLEDQRAEILAGVKQRAVSSAGLVSDDEFEEIVEMQAQRREGAEVSQRNPVGDPEEEGSRRPS